MRMPGQMSGSTEGGGTSGVLADARSDRQGGDGIRVAQHSDPTACAGLTSVARQLCLVRNGCLGARTEA